METENIKTEVLEKEDIKELFEVWQKEKETEEKIEKLSYENAFLVFLVLFLVIFIMRILI